ncbi:hypothetical protein DF19_26265 [Streptomyces olindensis]|nr:hypothetical protein DF19_26265 [Streptomyces olindensis]
MMDELLVPLVGLEQRVHQASSYYDDEPWQAENFSLDLPGKRELSLVATVAGEPVGFLIASRRPEGVHIHRVAVAPCHRGGGIASGLLGRLLAQAPGLVTLVCDPRNRSALALYARAGFRVTSTTPEGKLFLATGTALRRWSFRERKT